MRMSYEEWDAWARGSAIRRAGYAGLRRDVAVGLANWLAGVDEPPEAAVSVLREALEDASELVRVTRRGHWASMPAGDDNSESRQPQNDPRRDPGRYS
jgi:epoxyqueuosine reductase QueG